MGRVVTVVDGLVHCLFPASNRSFSLCGLASVTVDGADTAIVGQCQSDPTGDLAVFSGLVTVTQPGGGRVTVGAGSKVAAGTAQQPQPAGFTQADRAVFARLVDGSGRTLAVATFP